MASEHTAKAFDSDLQELTRLVAEMGGLAERQVADSVTALVREHAITHVMNAVDPRFVMPIFDGAFGEEERPLHVQHPPLASTLRQHGSFEIRRMSWVDAADYRTATKVQVNYQSIGSGGGIKQIQNKTVDFGASEMPLKPEELDKDGLLQFPTVIGGDVPVVNLEGVKPGELKLTGPLLADIYLGKIVKWNDPAIAALNAGKTLPATAIAPATASISRSVPLMCRNSPT